MEEEPLISYVICTYNSEEFIEANLQSIKNQDYSNQEIIVVDNCSSDSTREIIEEKFPKVKLIVMPNSDYGACETFNIGFETATGKYIGILDDDVELGNKWAAELVDKFETKEDNLAVLQPKIEEFDETEYSEEKNICEFKGCGVLVKKEPIEKMGYYNEDYFLWGNDYELGHKLVREGYNIRTAPEIVTRHKTTSVNPYNIPKYKRYFAVRNKLWNIWQFQDAKNGLINSFRTVARQTLFSLKNKTTFACLKGLFAAFLKFPKYAVFERNVCQDIDYRRWNTQEFLTSVKNITNHV